MNQSFSSHQKLILFYIVVGIFLLITLLTILAIFFGMPKINPEYEDKLFYALVVELIFLFFLTYKRAFLLDDGPKDKIWINFNQPASVDEFVGADAAITPLSLNASNQVQKINSKILREGEMLFVSPQLPGDTINAILEVTVNGKKYKGSSIISSNAELKEV